MRPDTQAESEDETRHIRLARQSCVKMAAIRRGAGEVAMDDHPVDLIATILARAEKGDPIAKENLFAALYDELHRLAQGHLYRTGSDLTLSPTTLLHEAYLDLAGRDGLAFPDRNRFLAYASRAMRRLIIDYVRHRDAQKRGGNVTFTSIENGMVPVPRGVDLEELGRALEELASLDAGLAELVDLKFFCGFTFAEIAAMRSVSDRTVQRDWAKARTLLHERLDDD
jgi:RNA polymerase sigma factor, TIGR02999 family